MADPYGSRRAETFGDPVFTGAILDRLLHHSKVLKIVGPSYRTKDVLADLPAREPHVAEEKGEGNIDRASTTQLRDS